MWESEILILGDGTVLAQCGPMRMFIDGAVGSVRQPELCRRAGREAVGFLERIAAQRNLLKRPAMEMDEPVGEPLAALMWNAARLVGDPDLTPMAAVAGAIADAVADFLENRGMTRVVVNNGGDLALRLKGNERLAVGIRPSIESQTVSHRIVAGPDLKIGGVATSGLGGRSFTRGVADAATILAARSVQADAAATAVANACNVESPSVVRRRAETIDPETDLAGLDVTVRAGNLSEAEREAALKNGLARARILEEAGLIVGACIFVQGLMGATPAMEKIMEALPKKQLNGSTQ